MQLFMEAHGGFPAVEAEAAGEGAVRTGERLLAFLSRAAVEGLGAQSARFDPLPHLCFGFEAEEEAPEGFAVEIEALLRALKAARAPERPQPPAAACEVRHPDEGALRAGEPRLLRLSVVDLQRPSLGEAGPQLGVGFEVCDEHDHPLYRFAMEGLAPFLAIGVPVLGEPPRRRLSFAEELDALSRDGRLPGEEDKGHNSPRSPGR